MMWHGDCDDSQSMIMGSSAHMSAHGSRAREGMGWTTGKGRQTVYLNDPKGVFVLRWYKEVTKAGSDVTGGRYQNKHCAAYKLTRDNDGAAFVYTSNVQLISKVYLQKTSQTSREPRGRNSAAQMSPTKWRR